jgi:hypothetical protein
VLQCLCLCLRAAADVVHDAIRLTTSLGATLPAPTAGEISTTAASAFNPASSCARPLGAGVHLTDLAVTMPSARADADGAACECGVPASGPFCMECGRAAPGRGRRRPYLKNATMTGFLNEPALPVCRCGGQLSSAPCLPQLRGWLGLLSL